jgi:hypothetical protein
MKIINSYKIYNPIGIISHNATNNSAKNRNSLFFNSSQMNMRVLLAALLYLLGLGQSLKIVV